MLRNQKGYSLVELLIGIGSVLVAFTVLTLMGGSIYVAFHFLQKVW